MKIAARLNAALFASLFAFAGCTVASPPGCGMESVYSTTGPDGKTTELRLDFDALARMPAWTPGNSDPPLSVAKASQLALAWGKHRYRRYDDVRIAEILLTSAGCRQTSPRWYYRVQFRPMMEGNGVLGYDQFVAVLMDGTIVEPTRKP
ncbi:hypothetical protein LK996_01145 [Lysobacter sp. A6]|uniref:Lipoprotein n=1 Tax=Noviluteimonas lactosilytica TaxID=2888523 RepID=A0ABS8JDS0_9GAMM|nr:hypothetical protein [Lysobacter lactosilyticus]MCC8361690.1 hypothetical protein [Lysobacter lactosilyticus]